ncbi:RICIN domain-containing protein [Sediminitomix flava]|uniref:Putative secreted protein (Por secretion system target) n=1 Tax=Sediminitomix flava TaxID=379075 RepID=A0A315Z4H7_SEDFL|nr:RICIN domain-containing protein [Sediminitomix flava]PWJ37984.1 putative secreted protein (Por secretion system target) [Sediminitomix flava]
MKHVLFYSRLLMCFIICSLFSIPAFALNAPADFYYFRNAALTEVTLYWTDKSSTESGFEIQQKTDGGNWSVVKTVNSNVTQTKITGLNANNSIEFRVRAFQGSSNYSPFTRVQRLVGKNSKLEVYPEVPGITNPKSVTVDGISFDVLQDQCPSEPNKGKATRLSTFYKVEVKTASGGSYMDTPTYETRPQIRDQRSQNDPFHSNGGHTVYGYGDYGPNSNVPNLTLHSRHWTNFDAQEDIVVRVTLLGNAPTSTINLNQTEIHPSPISVTQVNNKTIEVKLPAAKTGNTDHAKHFLIAFNRDNWETPRGQYSFEHPLMIFVNPVKPARASAPEGKIKTFDSGKLMVMGAGIHLPDNQWRFFGTGENATVTELYVPGDAYLHGGFYFKNITHNVKVWGRGIYSDELFQIYGDALNWEQRTPWARTLPVEGNTWGEKGKWDSKVGVENTGNFKVTFEGLSSLGARMGVVTDINAKLDLLDHKDVGYAGGLYQAQSTQTLYQGIYTVNDDDITYCHQNYTMRYCTSRNYVNGPTYQFGWGVNTLEAGAKVYDHIIIPSDRPANGSYGKNHGVFNSRLQSGNLEIHAGGYFENFTITGQDNIIFNLGISADPDRNEDSKPVSIFSDKVFKNFEIAKHSTNDNLLKTRVLEGKNWKSYVRFIHFDNLVIEGNKVNNINDGDFFDYEEGTLLHTITFFSMNSPVAQPTSGIAPIGQNITLFSEFNNKNVRVNSGLPVSLSPLTADTNSGSTFKVENAGNGYVALKAENGYYVKVDAGRYGYVYTEPDLLRGDSDTKTITDEAKFVWVDLANDTFALWSKATGLYVRVEKNTGPNNPLYAASKSAGNQTIFSKNGTGSSPSITDGTYFIQNKNSNLYVEIASQSIDNGANVQQWSGQTGNHKKWEITQVDGEWYKIVNVNSGKSLEVANRSTANGGNIQQWNYTDQPQKQWKFVNTTDGYFSIINRLSGKAMEVAARSTINGGNIQQWGTYNSGATHKEFKFIATTSNARKAITDTEIQEIIISPNPAKDFIQIRGVSKNSVVSIFNVQGNQVYKGEIKANEIKQLSTHSWAKGLFMIHIQNNEYTKTLKCLVY